MQNFHFETYALSQCKKKTDTPRKRDILVDLGRGSYIR